MFRLLLKSLRDAGVLLAAMLVCYVVAYRVALSMSPTKDYHLSLEYADAEPLVSAMLADSLYTSFPVPGMAQRKQVRPSEQVGDTMYRFELYVPDVPAVAMLTLRRTEAGSLLSLRHLVRVDGYISRGDACRIYPLLFNQENDPTRKEIREAGRYIERHLLSGMGEYTGERFRPWVLSLLFGHVLVAYPRRVYGIGLLVLFVCCLLLESGKGIFRPRAR